MHPFFGDLGSKPCLATYNKIKTYYYKGIYNLC